ncbi:MAG TPA: HEAT repeat domain-containing protein [Phycisphaerae bacterium]|nr:HEAT repeat domain-containing protein [Phycisphaerae bacterium]
MTHRMSLVAAVLCLAMLAASAGCLPTASTAIPLQGDAAARQAAATQMVLAKDPASAGSLRAALADEDPIVRRLAVYGLERIGQKKHAPAIVPLLGDQDPWVRRTAATALGKLRSRRSVPALIQALGHDDVHLRYEAFVALGRIGDPASQKGILAAMRDRRLYNELEVWDQVSIVGVLDRLFMTDPEAVDVLKWLLTYGTWDHPQWADAAQFRKDIYNLLIANRAAEILAMKYQDASGEPFLLQGLAGDDHMQQTSAFAAAAIKSTAAVPGLIKMLDSQWVNNKRYAIQALGAIGDAAAVEPLEKMLGHEDVGIRRDALEALGKIDGKQRVVDLSAPAAVIPQIAEADLKTPGNKRPPQFIVLGVDDCANIEGIESMLDIVETLAGHGVKVNYTMWVAPCAGDWQSRDTVKQKLIYQRLFDLGSEVAHHTLNHNPGGRFWTSLPKEDQIKQIDGCTQWYRDNIVGFTRPFSHKGGGGGRGEPVDMDFSRQLMAKQRFLYRGFGRGSHPDEQQWPTLVNGMWQVPTGAIDGNAPPVHATITRPIASDYPGMFDYSVADGAAMMKANLDYHYNHPRRPILAVNAFHDWGFKTSDDSTCKWTHRNQAAILKEFLLDVLVRNKDKYPDTHVVTFRQVVEYAASNGDLEHTLAAGNCQDSRNPVKPLID